jgi:hypothetical protein
MLACDLRERGGKMIVVGERKTVQAVQAVQALRVGVTAN